MLTSGPASGPPLRDGLDFAMCPPPERISRRPSAVTLLELMTVLVVISILAVILAPGYSYLRQRAQKAQCIGNLRSLHVATNAYVQDHQQWPQVALAKSNDPISAKIWIDVLQPYGLTQINWICPSIQQARRSPDLSDPVNIRIDYFATPFNAKPNAPFQLARQPWYVEGANIHGNGQEIIFSDGHVEEALDILRASQTGTGSGP